MKSPNDDKTAASGATASTDASHGSDTGINPKWGAKGAGDLCHALNLVIVVTFAIYVVTSIGGASPSNKRTEGNSADDDNDERRNIVSPIFDPLWVKEGFCVSNPDTPYWTSHDLCLYGDLILGIIGGVVYWVLHSRPGMKEANDLVKFAIPSIVAHGFGHGMVAMDARNGISEDLSLSYVETDSYQNISTVELVLRSLLFIVPLLKASMPHISIHVVLFISTIVFWGGLHIPRVFNFTYVQTVLMIAFSFNQLARPAKEKNTFEYALFPAIAAVPVGIIGWLESMTCTNFMIKIGGHIVYDYYIAVSVIAFYVLCYWRVSKEATRKKEEKTD